MIDILAILELFDLKHVQFAAFIVLKLKILENFKNFKYMAWTCICFTFTRTSYLMKSTFWEGKYHQVTGFVCLW